jgi:two-component system, OmpR family, alkaline phosphatase synthesis response regulator PhoP
MTMRKILVVEDEISIVEFLKDALEGEGYRVETASNGQEGLDRLSKSMVNVVLCDVMMPVMDGREMCRIIKSSSTYAHLPLIVMSAVSSVLKDFECEIAAFVQKPFNLDDMLAIIDQVDKSHGKDATC